MSRSEERKGGLSFMPKWAGPAQQLVSALLWGTTQRNAQQCRKDKRSCDQRKAGVHFAHPRN